MPMQTAFPEPQLMGRWKQALNPTSFHRLKEGGMWNSTVTLVYQLVGTLPTQWTMDFIIVCECKSFLIGLY